MSKDLSTQLPNPPELEPMPSTRSKIWRGVSLLFTIGGLALIGAGGWMFAQQQIETSKPAPRLLEVSVANLESTASPTLRPSPTPLPPTVTQQITTNTANDAVESPTAEPTATPEAAVQIEPTSAIKAASPTLEPTATASPGSVSDAKLVEETVLSLADNPLPVVEDEQETIANPTSPDEVLTGVPSAATASGLPLTRIVAESIGLDSEVTAVGWQQVVQDGVTANVWTVADYAAGWHRNSALPGQGGNIVLSAHHNIKGEVFRYTVDLEPGDVVTLYDEGQSYDYVVKDKFIVKDKGEPEAVRQENAKWIGPFNEERLTLVTCWPYNNNTHRLIVIARPVEPS